MRDIKFTKMVAAGNDFVVVQGSGFKVQGREKILGLAKKICDRRYGVGADGLLLLEKSKRADFKMRVFNPDGSEPAMCGNGLRCIALYAYQNKLAPRKMKVETLAGIQEAEVKTSGVRIKLSNPHSARLNIPIRVDEKKVAIHYINTGVPHAVLFVDKIDALDVARLGRYIRNHPLFAPDGANANFVKAAKGLSIIVRTYERGVEDETSACGTGAVASAVISNLVKKVKPPVKVKTRSGEILRVDFKRNDIIYDVYLEGPARVVYTGKYFCPSPALAGSGSNSPAFGGVIWEV